MNPESTRDGYFRSDNFTSNETSYLQVVGKLRQMGVSGGAYIGVGPEQNFTYIAKVRPEIAFIVDAHPVPVRTRLFYAKREFYRLLVDGAPADEQPAMRVADGTSSRIQEGEGGE